MLNIKIVSWALGLWGALSFVVCVLYGLPNPCRCTLSCNRCCLGSGG